MRRPDHVADEAADDGKQATVAGDEEHHDGLVHHDEEHEEVVSKQEPWARQHQRNHRVVVVAHETELKLNHVEHPLGIGSIVVAITAAADTSKNEVAVLSGHVVVDPEVLEPGGQKLVQREGKAEILQFRMVRKQAVSRLAFATFRELPYVADSDQVHFARIRSSTRYPSGPASLLSLSSPMTVYQRFLISAVTVS